MVAVEDVATFARVVLERPAEFESRRIEVAGDELTMEEVARVLGGAAGRELSYTPVALQVVRARSEQLGRLCAWLAWEGTHVDVDRLRRRYQEVGFRRLETWARRQDWEELLCEALGAEAGRAIASGAR